MKVFVRRASDGWREGKIREYYSDIGECIDALLNTEDFGSFDPSVIVSKADDMTKDKCGEECDYEVIIYDTWIE